MKNEDHHNFRRKSYFFKLFLYQLGSIHQIMAGNYMCQHVQKKRIKDINIEYPQTTVEGRIAAAYATIEDSPISNHVHAKIAEMVGIEYTPLSA